VRDFLEFLFVCFTAGSLFTIIIPAALFFSGAGWWGLIAVLGGCMGMALLLGVLYLIEKPLTMEESFRRWGTPRPPPVNYLQFPFAPF